MDRHYGRVIAAAAARPNVMEDPTKKVDELFDQLDKKFFQSELKKNGVLLEWNEQPSSTAGYCYQLDDDVRKSKRIYIVLNKPLLMLRKREDLVDTLLHEMIHALLFVQGIEERSGGHGPNFCRIMRNINRVAGTNITVHHRFHDAVDHCKDLAAIRKRKDEKKPAARPILKPTLEPSWQRRDMPVKEHSPYKPGAEALQNRRYRILNEINKRYAREVAHSSVKLIGYESDSDYDYDYDCENDAILDRRATKWMEYTRDLRDAKPMMRTIYQSLR